MLARLSLLSISCWALFGAGCYRPTIGDGAFRCGPGALCPSGFICGADDRCRSTGVSGNPDLGDVDGGGIFSGLLGAPDLTGASGVFECNTTTGEIRVIGAAGTTEIVHAQQAGFQNLAQAGGPRIAVWSFQSLTLPSTISVRPTTDSNAVPVFAAVEAITLRSRVDWRGFGGFGGAAGAAGTGRDSGDPLSGGQAGDATSGGGGGGHLTAGMPGAGTAGGAGGVAYGGTGGRPIHVGSGGGGGGQGGQGGNGGGAIAFLSPSITIGSMVDVRGGVGFAAPATTMGGGGGGGSGGGILVSGASITFEASTSFLAAGGKGGAGAMGGDAGGDGAAGEIVVAGTVTGTPNAAEPVTMLPDPVSFEP